MAGRLDGRRILVTQAGDFMGPVLVQVLTEHGAHVIADERPLTDPSAPAAVVADAGRVDVLVANLAIPAPATPAVDVDEAEWSRVFDALVHPLPRLVRAVLPQLIERRQGKILLMGSAAALRGMSRFTSYSAARGAQLGYLQSLGVELAKNGIQANAIAQNYVENPTYYPPELLDNPKFQERLKWEVPLGRLVTAREDAEFVAYLCGDSADCFVGQVFPVCGGWAPR